MAAVPLRPPPPRKTRLPVVTTPPNARRGTCAATVDLRDGRHVAWHNVTHAGRRSHTHRGESSPPSTTRVALLKVDARRRPSRIPPAHCARVLCPGCPLPAPLGVTSRRPSADALPPPSPPPHTPLACPHEPRTMPSLAHATRGSHTTARDKNVPASFKVVEIVQVVGCRERRRLRLLRQRPEDRQRQYLHRGEKKKAGGGMEERESTEEGVGRDGGGGDRVRRDERRAKKTTTKKARCGGTDNDEPAGSQTDVPAGGTHRRRQ